MLELELELGVDALGVTEPDVCCVDTGREDSEADEKLAALTEETEAREVDAGKDVVTEGKAVADVSGEEAVSEGGAVIKGVSVAVVGTYMLAGDADPPYTQFVPRGI